MCQTKVIVVVFDFANKLNREIDFSVVALFGLKKKERKGKRKRCVCVGGVCVCVWGVCVLSLIHI